MPRTLLTSSLSRKAQLQIGESMLVLLVIGFLGVFLLVFFAKSSAVSNQLRLDEFQSLDAVQTAQVATSLYELRCAKPGLKSTCVDLHKAQALARLTGAADNQENDLPLGPEVTQQANNYYFDLFKESKITLTIIYPRPQGEEVIREIVLYENKAADEENQQTSLPFMIPVSVHDSVEDTMSFGMLRIDRYAQQRTPG